MLLDREYPPDIRVENEIEALISKGHAVHVVCFTLKDRKIFDTHMGAVVHRKPISKFIYKSSIGCLKFPFYFNFWRRFLNKLFSEDNFDAIHVHDLPLAKVGYEFAQKHNIPLTLDLHENWPALLRMATHTKSALGRLLSNNTQWEHYELKYARLANHIIVVVDEAKQRLVNLGLKETKIQVVSNTLNLKHFDLEATDHDPNKIVLVYAGGIDKDRGLQYPILGLSEIKKNSKKVEFWILGTGNYIEELKKLARESGVEDHVIFYGWKPYREMQLFISKADICLIPHVKSDHTDSTIPHKLFQYMYAKKPVIASDCAPIKRIIEESECGLIYPFDQPQIFADQLMLLANDITLLKKFQDNGRLAVINHYLWDIDAERLINIYQ